MAQASTITATHGAAPTTAACFLFGVAGARGQIKAPDSCPIGFAINFDALMAMQETHANIMEPEFRNSAEELELRFRCADVGGDVVYDINAKLLQPLLSCGTDRSESYRISMRR